ncbi:MAG: SDR family NAD(P)-dependent oxidoreductase [Terracidiphilus sp.]
MSSVLITGTSKGIGYETALAFARIGHTVHATMRTPSQSGLAGAAAQEKLNVSITAMDVDSDESVCTGIAAIQNDHGSIDVLVNNAGIEASGAVARQNSEPIPNRAVGADIHRTIRSQKRSRSSFGEEQP